LSLLKRHREQHRENQSDVRSAHLRSTFVTRRNGHGRGVRMVDAGRRVVRPPPSDRGGRREPRGRVRERRTEKGKKVGSEEKERPPARGERGG